MESQSSPTVGALGEAGNASNSWLLIPTVGALGEFSNAEIWLFKLFNMIHDLCRGLH